MDIANTVVIHREGLKSLLPHRGVALLLDEVIYNEGENEIIGRKKVFEEDAELDGHFPDFPVYPGHYLDELACLTAACLVKLICRDGINGLPMVIRKDGIQYKKAARPGDALSIKVALLENKGNRIFIFSSQIFNQNKELVASIEKITGMAAK